MEMHAPPEVQRILDDLYATDVVDYVNRYNAMGYPKLATVDDVVRRFRIKQTDVERLANDTGKFAVSTFAYDAPLSDDSMMAMYVSMWTPQEYEGAPLGKRLIVVL